jgi:hypothetical protein
MSSISAITRHPSFGAILEIGEPAIPLILRRIDAGDMHIYWFPLLKRISGEDPVPSHKRGRTSLMTAEWLRWGRERGYLKKDAR